MQVTNDQYILRPLSKHDWQMYREIKLGSFANTPSFFMRTYSDELLRSDVSWQNELEEPGCKVLGAFYEDKIVGISTILKNKKDPTSAISTGSYVEKDHRKNGVFSLLSDYLINWCRDNNFDAIVGSHKDGNQPMRNIMLTLDFVETGKKMGKWADGSEGYEVMYRKELKQKP